jgi:hypothetical protein
MENTFTGMDSSLEKPAVRNGSVAGDRIKLVLLWLAVGLPMLWGAMKALENIGSLPL